METPMRMPDLATTGSPMTVVRILAAVGDAVARGQPVLEVETDKAVMNVESAVNGVLTGLGVEEGAEVVSGQVVAVFEVKQAGLSPPPTMRTGAAAKATVGSAARPASAPSAGSDRVSFFARNRARRAGKGEAGPRALSVVERAVARRTQASKQTVPHFYVQTSANAEGLVKRRAAFEGRKPVWDAFFAIAAAKALKDHPRFGCRFDEDKLTPHGGGAIGVAVDLDGDLHTVAIDDPAGKDVGQVSGEIRSGIDRIKGGGPGGGPTSLTISNLGGSNVETFTAVVNAPESAILAIGKVAPTVVVLDGRALVQDRVNLTLSVDHRVAGGKAAAAFLNAIVRELESFQSAAKARGPA